MSSWADRLGVFDLETTGVDVETARVVTACIAVLDADGQVLDRWDWIADPGVEIPTARLNNKPPHGRIDTTEREAGERKHDFKCIECGLTDEEAYSEASRCLRCDHFGYGIFRGGRKGKW